MKVFILFFVIFLSLSGRGESPEACTIDGPKQKGLLQETHTRYSAPVARKISGDTLIEQVKLKDGRVIIVSQSNCGSLKSIEFQNVKDKTPVSRRSHYFSEVSRFLTEKLGPEGRAIDEPIAKTFLAMAAEIDIKLKKPQIAQPLEAYGSCTKNRCDAKFTDSKLSTKCSLVVSRAGSSKVNLLVTVESMEAVVRRLNENF